MGTVCMQHDTIAHRIENKQKKVKGEGEPEGLDIYVGGGAGGKIIKRSKESLHASTSEGRSRRKGSSEKGMRNKGKVKKKEGNGKRNTKKPNNQGILSELPPRDAASRRHFYL